MRGGQRFAAAVLVILVGASTAGLASCGDSAESEGGAGPAADSDSDSESDTATGLDGPFPLPFGLDQIDGTEPVGRPAIYDEEAFTFNGEPVRARTLQAAYRVTADDPPAVVRAWVDQLGDGLALDEATIGAGRGGPRGLWMQAGARTEYESNQPRGDNADLQLWATDGVPILLVEVSRISDDPPRNPTIEDEAGNPPAPADVIEDTERTAGDGLFTEQGDEIRLPEGTRPLMPTLPTFGGTGGSTSVLAADDGEAAVRALLDQAQAASEHGEVTGPEVTVAEPQGTEIVTAGFDISAGGWGFDVVSIRAPDDPSATVYVTSYAD